MDVLKFVNSWSKQSISRYRPERKVQLSWIVRHFLVRAVRIKMVCPSRKQPLTKRGVRGGGGRGEQRQLSQL